MKKHSRDASQKDVELGLSASRSSAEYVQNGSGAQRDGLPVDSADRAYDDAGAAGQQASRISRASSLRSLPPAQYQVGNDTIENSYARPTTGFGLHSRPSSPVTYMSGSSKNKASQPGRPYQLKRVKTSVIQGPDIADAPEDQTRQRPLNSDDPGAWAVDHHHDELLRKIIDVSAGGLLRDLFSVSSRKKSGSKDEKPTEHSDVNPRQGPPEPTYRISFAEMQRMHLRKLQVKLVKHAIHMYKEGREARDSTWESDLAEYIQAMKDYDYMTESSKLPQDFFLATGERKVDRYVIDTVIKQMVGGAEALHTREMKECTRVEQVKDDSAPIGGIRGEKTRLKKAQDFRDRILLAMIGASLLLGPTWLMVLHNTLYTGLVTTTVCVAIVGLVASWRLEKPNDVLSVTAAYAAVLVVFVGLTNSD